MLPQYFCLRPTNGYKRFKIEAKTVIVSYPLPASNSQVLNNRFNSQCFEQESCYTLLSARNVQSDILKEPKEMTKIAGFCVCLFFNLI